MRTKALLALLLIGVLALAQVNFPTRPVTIIVPWSAGGATDLLFRAIASVFPKYANGQPLVVNNIPGAGAVTGTMEFLKAPADGYTLLSLATPIITKIHWSEVKFTVDDFVPVINIVNDPSYILVNANSPYKTLEDLLNAARKNPETVTMGNGGAGGGNHLVALAFEDFVGVRFIHVPYNGGAPAIADLVAGHIDAVMAAAPEGVPQVQAGQLRCLAVLGTQRLSVFPDVPTARELGYDFTLGMWRGVAVQRGTPPEIVRALHDIFYKCMNDPEFIARAKEMGNVLHYMDTVTFTRFVREQNAFWENLMKIKKVGEKYGK
ncbi:MAG: tripartite tricarboxylate transporter substrate binding protein [Thermotoga caldifontis]|uniref:tripartite tricarboxylate transporter substrate binding protein n=1 Tax=Thermotoga caldifontis TaxID=1508419 RepID=UPI003C7CD1A9